MLYPVYVEPLQRKYRVDCRSSGSCCANDNVTPDLYEKVEALFDSVWITLTLDTDLQAIDSQNDAYIYFGCVIVLNGGIGVLLGKHFNNRSDRLAFPHP